MHPSSIKNMELALDYLRHWSFQNVLDVGGRKHSYRACFPTGIDYRIADIQDGEGVTDVMPGPFDLPFGDERFDLVVSGQMLEHCANPFKSVREMKRVLRPGGRIILIAPSAGPRHDVQDGWRFMDDAFRFIAEDVGLNILGDWITRDAPDERSRKWQDHVFIGEKPYD